MRWTGSTLCVATALSLGLLTPRLAAQTNLETNAGIQFNFGAPGAANLALGGAFIGLAFDGTAAYTNPAGLTTILDPEAWIEARRWSYTHVFTDRGRIAGVAPTGQPGDPDNVDNHAGLVNGEATNDLAGLSFASYVHPLGSWSLAVYYHRLLDFEADFSTHGAFLERVRSTNPQGFGILGEHNGRLPALRNTMSTTIDSVGLAAGWKVAPTVSLGVALSESRFRIDSLAERFVPAKLTAPVDFGNASQHKSDQIQEGTDSDWSWNLGVLWQSPSRAWSAGATYRRGPGFDFRTISSSRSMDFMPIHRRAVFHVPDVYGLGFAWRPTDRFTLAADVDRVEYSDLLDDLVDIFGLATLIPGADPELAAFHIDDADELHLGAELWIPRGDRALSIRVGSWYDPDHGLRFDGRNVSYRAVFRGGSDQVHVTAGAGLALRRVQVDLGLDYSDRLSIASLSAGMRF